MKTKVKVLSTSEALYLLAEKSQLAVASLLEGMSGEEIGEFHKAVAAAKASLDAENQERKADKPPFKFFVVAGGDWITFTPKGDETIAKAWKDFHGYALPKSAKISVVHPSYAITNGGLNYSSKAGAWSPVEVK